jgi:eukaryotic-like serine/threonine-protein kinase
LTEAASRLAAVLADRYRLERELGAGGMATVYLAEDLKHDRKVALKVLKPELAAVLGGDRFVQEIKTTAALQHPHILPLFDSGTADGFLYYVMPYVQGETLRDKLNRETQLGIDEAVGITTAVADALDYAHRHGVIHRDIKPENILLHDGRPMVADFGIALAVSAAAGGRMTETGMSLGTPHYMSPEQATADKDLSARSDVYSLASVLYEMLTGEPPHMGNSAQQIIMKIIAEQAKPVTELRKSVPPHVVAAVGKALEKLPADRFASAAEFAAALKNPAFTATVAGTAAHGAAPGRRAPAVPVLGTIALLATVAAAWGWLRSNPQAAVARFDIGVTGGPGPATVSNGASLAIAPDGSHFVYVGTDGILYDRDLDHLESRPLPARGYGPFFSPDGEWVGYADGITLKKVAPAGGPPLAIASVRTDLFRGGSWGEDGTIVFAPDVISPLLRVSEGGGRVDTLTRLDAARGETSHRWPEWLPGQRGVLLQACRGSAEQCEIAVFDLRSDSVRYLVPGTSPHYIATGHLVYTSPAGGLLAAPFDLDRMELTGNPISLMEGILMRASYNGEFAIARNGTLLYLSGQSSGGNLTLLDSVGNGRTLLADLIDAQAPRFSPDGRRIAFAAATEGPAEVWVYDRILETVSRLTFEGNAMYPAWTADGDTVYYSTDKDSPDRDIWRRAADGSGGAEHVLERPGQQFEIALPVAGQNALIREIASTSGDLYVLPLTPGGEPRPWVVSSFSERAPSLSPDGRWAAYTSDESGQNEIYVRAFPEAEGRWQVSSGGGTEPLWTRDGRTIYYRRADTLFAAAVETRPTFAVVQRRTVFITDFLEAPNHINYDRHDSTGEFVVVARGDGAETSLVVVLNWFEEVRQRMGREQ